MLGLKTTKPTDPVGRLKQIKDELEALTKKVKHQAAVASDTTHTADSYAISGNWTKEKAQILAEARQRDTEAWVALRELEAQERALIVERVWIEGELDRRARGWTPPQAVELPELPDARLPDDERLEALDGFISRISRRLSRVQERTDAARHRMDQASPGTTAAMLAQYADARRDYEASRDEEVQLERLREEARGQLRRLEGRPVI
jgi:hypothetical protein